MTAEASPAPRRAPSLLLGAGLVLVAAASFAGSPLLAVAVGIGLLLVGITLHWPGIAVHAVLFLLYSNLPAVSVAFHGVPKPVAAAFPLLLLVPLAHDFARGGRLVLTPAFALLSLFLAVQLVGAAFAREPDVALASAGAFAIEGVLLYLLVVNVVRTRERLVRATWSLVAAGVLMSVVPLYQQVTGTFEHTYGGLAQVDGAGFDSQAADPEEAAPQRQLRLAGTIGEKNRYAQVMLVVLPLALSRWLVASGSLARLLAACCSASIALGFALAFSRGGAIGAACVVVTMLALRLIDVRKAALVAAGLALVLAALPQYWSRLESIGSSVEGLVGGQERTAVDGAVRRRVTSMLAASRAFIDHPLVGVGPGMFVSHSQEYGNQDALRRLESGRRAHSLFLEIAAETGVAGLGLFIAALYATLHGLVVARRACSGVDPPLAHLCAAYLLGLVAYLGTGLFLHLSYVRYFALLMGLCGAAAEVALQASRSGAARVELPRRGA